MALARLTALFLVVLPALAEATSLLQKAASRQRRVFAGLRYSPQDPAARTLLTLDTNHDSRIDPGEVAAFARSQGLDAAAATQEFSSIDSNGDGVLDSMELMQLLGGSPTAQETSTVAKPQVQQEVQQEALVEDPLAASVPLASEAMAGVPAEAPKAMVAVPPEAPEAMVTVLHSREGSAAQPVVNAELISEESRNSVRMAAQKLSQELDVEEAEERKARDLDRKAAEVHAKSTALAKRTVQDALEAGSKAAHKKADELLAKISKLEEQAERAEVRAVALKAKAKMEMEEGNQLMAAADQALS